MSKFTKLLNKYIKRTFTSSSYEKKVATQYSKEWEKQGGKIVLKTEMDYIEMSTVFQSIANKIQIENNYLLVKDNLVEFWSTLDYSERKRIINIDMKETYDKLPKFMSFREGKDLFITFFDARMNEIYSEETVMFELKQYHQLFLNYKDFIQPFSTHNYDVYNGVFVPTICLYKDEASVCLYNYTLGKFYLIENGALEVYPLFDNDKAWKELTNELLIPLAELLKDHKENEFFDMAKAFGLYSEEFYRKVNRNLTKKFWF